MVHVEEMGLFSLCGRDGVILSMWRRCGYLVHVKEIGLFYPCGDVFFLVQVEEMGLFSPGGGHGFI